MIRTSRLLLDEWRDDHLKPDSALNAPVAREHFPSVVMGDREPEVG